MGAMKQVYITIVDELYERFDGKCAYCNTPYSIDELLLEYYDPNKHESDYENYTNFIICCNYCNNRKGAFLPLDESGNDIIVNPLKDKFDEHIKLVNDGSYIAITPKGENSIRLFNLNEKKVIENRISRVIEDFRLQGVYSNFETIIGSENAYNSFKNNSLKLTEILKSITLQNDENVKKYLISVLYSNAITLLETYLSDTFIKTVLSDTKYIKKFTETFHDFREETFKLPQIYDVYDTIDRKVTTAMLDVIYHNIAKVQGMYRDTLGVEFPRHLQNIYKAVQIRHDIVHRNGKDKEGKQKNIEVLDVIDILKDIDKFIEYIQNQINKIII